MTYQNYLTTVCLAAIVGFLRSGKSSIRGAINCFELGVQRIRLKEGYSMPLPAGNRDRQKCRPHHLCQKPQAHRHRLCIYEVVNSDALIR